MQVLIIQTAFLGDVVLATPVIEKLHRFFPGIAIDFLLRKGNEQVLQNHPKIRELIIWDKKKGKWNNALRLIQDARRHRYDYVINLQRFATSGLITAFSGGRETIGFDKNPMSFLFTRKIRHHIAGPGEPVIHEVQRNLACIEAFTDKSEEQPRLYPSSADFGKVNPLKPEPYVVMAPASVWFTKQYPHDKWVDLIRSMADRYMIYLVGAPPDDPLCQQIIVESGVRRIQNLTGKLSLLQSAALMKDARMNYVNDSAPLHMASAMDAPVTAIFCSTVPGFGFGPSGTKGRVIETPLPLSCRPCGLHGHRQCPKGHFRCAYSIDTRELLAIVD